MQLYFIFASLLLKNTPTKPCKHNLNLILPNSIHYNLITVVLMITIFIVLFVNNDETDNEQRDNYVVNVCLYVM